MVCEEYTTPPQAGTKHLGLIGNDLEVVGGTVEQEVAPDGSLMFNVMCEITNNGDSIESTVTANLTLPSGVLLKKELEDKRTVYLAPGVQEVVPFQFPLPSLLKPNVRLYPQVDYALDCRVSG